VQQHDEDASRPGGQLDRDKSLPNVPVPLPVFDLMVEEVDALRRVPTG